MGLRLLWVMLLLGVSCYSPSLKSTRPYTKMANRLDHTVLVRVVCENGAATGSGLIIGPRHVLTAAHVATPCDNPELSVRTHTGEMHSMVVYRNDDGADVAIIAIPDNSDFEFESYLRVAVGPVPGVGSSVCIVTGAPRRSVQCGVVGELRDRPPGNIEHSAVTEPGNSGGGIFDGYGRLVGVVTHFVPCLNMQFCGGRGTSLWDRREFLDID